MVLLLDECLGKKTDQEEEMIQRRTTNKIEVKARRSKGQTDEEVSNANMYIISLSICLSLSPL